MKKIAVILIQVSLIILSCGINPTEKEAKNDSTINFTGNSENQDNDKPMQVEEYLVILGKDIWIRDFPKTGQVIMKLNDGDKCKILEAGKIEAVHGRPDYWYKIVFNNVQGWVFGSQTDKMLFTPLNKKLVGGLNALCDNQIVHELETPPAFNYVFKNDKTFHFFVAAGYSINGKFEQNGNILTLKEQQLILQGAEVENSTMLKGTITFEVFAKDELICLTEKKNTLSDKTYSPASGTYCLSK